MCTYIHINICRNIYIYMSTGRITSHIYMYNTKQVECFSSLGRAETKS